MSEHESDGGTLAGRPHADKPDVQILREALDYDPETGCLKWKIRPERHFATRSAAGQWNRKYPGRIAGCKGSGGYLVVCLSGVQLRCHQVAWAIATGCWPKLSIDHINGNPSDNRYENLRLATTLENLRNTRLNCRNRSGVKGVFWVPNKNRWRATLRFNGKVNHLGLHRNMIDAIQAVRAAREKHHGEFANHG